MKLKGFLMKYSNENEAGFTLVELMVVVSIVGILSSIAIPSYMGFRARARQSEAKITLASIYVGEASYFITNSSYTTCLSETGFDHTLTANNNYYAIGFASVTSTCGPAGNMTCHIQDSNGTPCGDGAFPAGAFWPATASIAGAPISWAAFQTDVTTTISSNQFTAAAVGSISSLGTTVADTWTINEDRSLSNIRSGL
jgi:prepilin-type N-terminal cleavage/methylation domain-containing protein